MITYKVTKFFFSTLVIFFTQAMEVSVLDRIVLNNSTGSAGPCNLVFEGTLNIMDSIPDIISCTIFESCEQVENVFFFDQLHRNILDLLNLSNDKKSIDMNCTSILNISWNMILDDLMVNQTQIESVHCVFRITNSDLYCATGQLALKSDALNTASTPATTDAIFETTLTDTTSGSSTNPEVILSTTTNKSRSMFVNIKSQWTLSLFVLFTILFAHKV